MPQWSKPQLLDSMAENSILHAPMADSPVSVYMAQSQPSNSSTPWQRTRFSMPQWQKQKPSACLAYSQLQTDVFFKIPIFSAHCFLAWCHSHSSLISCLGFIMTIVIVISFALERKLYPMLCTWTKSRTVQSPTKLNDKI